MNHTLHGPHLRWQIEIEERAAARQRQARLERENEEAHLSRLRHLADAEREAAQGPSRAVLFAIALVMAVVSIIAVRALVLHGLTLIPGGKP